MQTSESRDVARPDGLEVTRRRFLRLAAGLAGEDIAAKVENDIGVFIPVGEFHLAGILEGQGNSNLMFATLGDRLRQGGCGDSATLVDDLTKGMAVRLIGKPVDGINKDRQKGAIGRRFL